MGWMPRLARSANAPSTRPPSTAPKPNPTMDASEEPLLSLAIACVASCDPRSQTARALAREPAGRPAGRPGRAIEGLADSVTNGHSGARMKTVVVAALALLGGLFLGGVRPRAEVRALQKDLAEAKQAGARGGSAAALPLALG